MLWSEGFSTLEERTLVMDDQPESGRRRPRYAGKLLKVSEAAQILNVSPHTLRKWANRGLIKVLRYPSGMYRIPGEEIDELLGNTENEANRE
jgi:excisionase family DNA binding protein